MKWVALGLSLLLIGSIGWVNSPGSASDPVVADDGDLRQYQGVAADMHARWQALDADCDPDAVFALLYLVTTAKVGDLVAAEHFEDNPYLVDWDEDFAQRYLQAYDDYHAGRDVPEPWRIAFDHAASGHSTVTEDMLLGMNAHVNYDLSFSAYTMQLPQMGQKDEYDRVNDAFWNVVVPVGNEFGARYDPGQARSSQNLTESDLAIVELLISWREGAWANANALAAAPTPLARSIVAKGIEAEAATIARGLAANFQDTRDERRAYCHASGHPALAAELGGDGYGDPWFDGHTVDKFWICTNPGTDKQQTQWANEHSWQAKQKQGATKGAC